MLHIRHIKKYPGLLPKIGESPSHCGVIGIVQHIASQQHGVSQRLHGVHRQAFSGDHIGDDGHITTREIFAAPLIVQHIGTGAGEQVNVLAC